jgi:sterol 14alpha-demethylase
MRALPPMVSGALPVVGHTLEFLRDPVPLIERGHREHGNISMLLVGGRPMIILAGPEYARIFFEQTDKSLSIRDGMAFLSRLFSSDFYFLAEASEYQRQREIVLPRFQSRQLDGYLKIMETQAAEFIQHLGSEGEFDLLDELGPVVIRIAADAFLGSGFGGRSGFDFFTEFRRFSAGIDPVMPGWLPLPHFIRGRRSRARLQAMVGQMIQARREHRPRDNHRAAGLGNHRPAAPPRRNGEGARGTARGTARSRPGRYENRTAAGAPGPFAARDPAPASGRPGDDPVGHRGHPGR